MYDHSHGGKAGPGKFRNLVSSDTGLRNIEKGKQHEGWEEGNKLTVVCGGSVWLGLRQNYVSRNPAGKSCYFVINYLRALRAGRHRASR